MRADADAGARCHARGRGRVRLVVLAEPQRLGGRPMPSTIASDEELKQLVGVLKECGKGIFVMATGPRGTPEYMEAIAAETGRPAFMVTVLTMYSKAQSGARARVLRALRGGDRARPRALHPLDLPAAVVRLHAARAVHPLFARRVRSREGGGAGGARGDLPAEIVQRPVEGELPESEAGDPVLRRLVAGGEGRRAGHRSLPPIRWTTSSTCRSIRSSSPSCSRTTTGRGAAAEASGRRGGAFGCRRAPDLFLRRRLRAALPRALGARDRHLHAGGGGAPPDERSGAQVPHPEARRDRAGYSRDLLLFDPATVGISELERVADLPGGGTRMIRKPRGVHGVWVNGLRVFDGEKYIRRQSGPGSGD